MSASIRRTSSIVERYGETTPRSRALFERAARSLPGGNTRSTLYMQPYPFYFAYGSGCRIYDVDGNERLDFINNYTSLILGHGHPKVVAAVSRQLSRGASVAAPTELEVELAERIKARLPSIDLLRFANSGTEATLLALRAARAHTRREKIAKFLGSYHGSHDYAAADPTAPNPGIPGAVVDSVVLLPFNDPQAVEPIVERHRHDLAAVIVEPVIGAGGVIPAAPGFLGFLRELTARYGIVLIFDEVISFRTGYSGAQGRYGIAPDLTTLGKIIGGGLPVGAVGGREEIMACFDPRRPAAIAHGGTFNGNPLTSAAGLATLEELTPDTYVRLEALAGDLKRKLDALFGRLGVAAQVQQVGSLFAIHFSEAPVTDHASYGRSDRDRLLRLHLAALNHGVALSSRGIGCLSTPMDGADVDVFVAALERAFLDGQE